MDYHLDEEVGNFTFYHKDYILSVCQLYIGKT